MNEWKSPWLSLTLFTECSKRPLLCFLWAWKKPPWASHQIHSRKMILYHNNTFVFLLAQYWSHIELNSFVISQKELLKVMIFIYLLFCSLWAPLDTSQASSLLDSADSTMSCRHCGCSHLLRGQACSALWPDVCLLPLKPPFTVIWLFKKNKPQTLHFSQNSQEINIH